MYATKLLTGLAIVGLVVAFVGTVGSLDAAFLEGATMATTALLALAMLGVVAAGVGGIGGADAARTPYW